MEPAMDLLNRLHPQIVEKAGVGLLVYELEDEGDAASFRIVFVNQTAADLTHNDPKKLMGMSILEAFPNLGETGAPEAFRKAILDESAMDLGDITYGDERIPTAIFAVEAMPLESRFVVVSFRDVTELRALRRELEEKLLGMEKMAMLGNLLAGIAHEIRTPLGALASNNDMVRSVLLKVKNELAEDSQVAPLVDRIEKATEVSITALEQITELVDSLRRMGRKREVEMTAVDVHKVLESTLTLLHHELKYGVNVHTDFGDLTRVVGDAGQLTQVFTNVMLNACQAMSGHGNLWITTRPTADGVEVSIRDDGNGILPEHINQIFEPGFTTKDAAVGTGLGLTITAEILRAHDGSVDVTSAPNEGATFRIALPAAQRRSSA
jgi:signal transduction histidine kinase